MNIEITANGLASFGDDEVMGIMTFGDRKILEQRRLEMENASRPDSGDTDEQAQFEHHVVVNVDQVSPQKTLAGKA